LYFGLCVAETDVVFAGANNKEQTRGPSKLSGRAPFTAKCFMVMRHLYEFRDCLTREGQCAKNLSVSRFLIPSPSGRGAGWGREA